MPGGCLPSGAGTGRFRARNGDIMCVIKASSKKGITEVTCVLKGMEAPNEAIILRLENGAYPHLAVPETERARRRTVFRWRFPDERRLGGVKRRLSFDGLLVIAVRLAEAVREVSRERLPVKHLLLKNEWIILDERTRQFRFILIPAVCRHDETPVGEFFRLLPEAFLMSPSERAYELPEYSAFFDPLKPFCLEEFTAFCEGLRKKKEAGEEREDEAGRSVADGAREPEYDETGVLESGEGSFGRRETEVLVPYDEDKTAVLREWM